MPGTAILDNCAATEILV